MLPTDKLAALRVAAAAATPGPWEHQTSNGWHRVGTTAANRGRRDGDVVAVAAARPADMAYIAAANPAAIQELLADLDAKTERIAELELLLAAERAASQIERWPEWRRRVVGRAPSLTANTSAEQNEKQDSSEHVSRQTTGEEIIHEQN
ncbi:ead/Ea22-like family protein [Chromobacterium violaceum]|uniref:ead/Ea22-like family protein n=1 Tax=Chromobacterium violaceum TaxID=536 RepID=UPI0015FD1319|nr:ead/Ea22-like family protein [Chromobacterium violaceum]MBA8734195.1 ead/Ea22-like family protein [Chromobacterium violaceum]